MTSTYLNRFMALSNKLEEAIFGPDGAKFNHIEETRKKLHILDSIDDLEDVINHYNSLIGWADEHFEEYIHKCKEVLVNIRNQETQYGPLPEFLLGEILDIELEDILNPFHFHRQVEDTFTDIETFLCFRFLHAKHNVKLPEPPVKPKSTSKVVTLSGRKPE